VANPAVFLLPLGRSCSSTSGSRQPESPARPTRSLAFGLPVRGPDRQPDPGRQRPLATPVSGWSATVPSRFRPVDIPQRSRPASHGTGVRGSCHIDIGLRHARLKTVVKQSVEGRVSRPPKCGGTCEETAVRPRSSDHVRSGRDRHHHPTAGGAASGGLPTRSEQALSWQLCFDQYLVLDCSTYQLKAQIPVEGADFYQYSYNWRLQKLYVTFGDGPKARW